MDEIKPKHAPTPLQWTLFIAVLLMTLFAGLNPKDYKFQNQVTWLTETAGVSVGRYGLIYSDNFLINERVDALNTRGFTLEIAFELNKPYDNGFNLLAQFYSEDDSSQLIIGNWQDLIIIMNGDDYAYLRREPRIETRIGDSPFTSQLISVGSDQDGTKLYLNGQLQIYNPNLFLSIPKGEVDTSLVLGNSVYGNAFIEGSLFGFAVYEEVLNEEAVRVHHRHWRAEKDFAFASADEVYAYYLFDENDGNKLLNHAGDSSADLLIPQNASPLKKQLFVNPFKVFAISLSFIFDVTINLFGFMPFGYMMALVLFKSNPGIKTSNIFAVMAIGIGLSFGIESLQTWLPSRTSSLLDLSLNSVGALFGALLFKLRHRINAKEERKTL